MSIVNPLDLDTLTLARGSHGGRRDAMCVMEAAAFIAGEDWTDQPACVSPVIATFLRVWNDDTMDDDDRQMLVPFTVRVIGTRTTPEVEAELGWMAAPPTTSACRCPHCWRSSALMCGARDSASC